MRELVKDRDRLDHILEAIDRILAFTSDKTKDKIEADSLNFYGIVKNIEIIGEAAYKLTNAYRSKHPETEWETIAKMRHVLVHEYYHIDAEQIWNVIKCDLVNLHTQIVAQIHNTNWEEWENNKEAVSESAVRKSLIQTAARMKRDGLNIHQIIRYTGLSKEEIEDI